MSKIFAAWNNNRLTLVLFIAAIIGLPVLAALNTPPQTPIPSSPTPHPLHSGVTLPPNYRADYIHYATVQRPDGTIRDIYINPEGLKVAQQYIFPEQTTIVIEGYYAARDDNGKFRLDENGHYIRGEYFEAVHVRQKRFDWLPGDFVSEARNGYWNYGSFETKTGQPFDESITACFNCHHASEQQDFLFTYPQLLRYTVSGEPQFFICNLTGRSAC